MSNEVVNYNAATAITTTPTTNIFGAAKSEQKYNMLRVKNEDTLDIILTFGNSQTFIAKAGDDVLQPFECTAEVALSTASGTTSANIFIQLTRG